MNRRWTLVALLFVLLTLTACGQTPAYEGETFHVVVPNGTPVLALAQAIEEKVQFIEGAKVTYEIVLSTDLLVAKLVSGEADFALAPTNLAAKLYNGGLPYRLASVDVWGNLYLAGPKLLEDLSALKGETVAMIGQNLSPDILFRYYLKEAGLDPEKDVTLEYMTGATELAPLYLSGQYTYSMMPEPMLSAVMGKSPETKIALDFQKHWKKVHDMDTSYPQAGLLVKKEILDQYPQVAEGMMDLLEENVAFANEDPRATGETMEALETGLKAPMVALSMPRNNLEHHRASDVKEALDKYFEILYDFNPATLGGKLPDDGLTW